MKKINAKERIDWRSKVESDGFCFHTPNNIKYWDESSYYEFRSEYIDKIETSTSELFNMCLTAVQHVIDNNLFDKLHIDRRFIKPIIDSWENETPSIYGRFDLVCDGINPPKMLEFNADTPTSLLEASVIQWRWLSELHPSSDQFNSIHEKLIEHWSQIKPYLKHGTLYFTSIKGSDEDLMTVNYLMDTATQAGITCHFTYIEDIGISDESNDFIDIDGNTIHDIFKLYPWEWLTNEEFSTQLLSNLTHNNWIEPPWKMILSNKGILPILWELFPNHENLLECYFDTPRDMVNYVKKPIYSREGANVTIFNNNTPTESTDGEYGDEGYVYQQLSTIPNFDNNHPIVGSWVIGCQPAGMGIRESTTLITNNTSRFVPHLFN